MLRKDLWTLVFSNYFIIENIKLSIVLPFSVTVNSNTDSFWDESSTITISFDSSDITYYKKKNKYYKYNIYSLRTNLNYFIFFNQDWKQVFFYHLLF